MNDAWINASQHSGNSWHTQAQLKVQLKSEEHLADILKQSVVTSLSKAGGLTVPAGSYTLRVLVTLTPE